MAIREIIFRGKKVDNGEWVISDCFFQCNEKVKLWDNPNKDGWVIVNIETIGHFTGLTDKNGTKIFEGDIVKIHRKYLNAGCEEDCLYEVIWHKNWCSWALRNLKPTQCCYLSDAKDGEIIGNIHDNKEFLGE